MHRERFESQRAVVLLFALCVAVRVYLFFFTFVIARDSTTYLAMAEAFLEGRIGDALHYITLPFYPILVAGIQSVVGNWEIAGKLVSGMAGVGTFFPLYFLGNRVFGHKATLISLLCLAIHPYLVEYSAEVLSESTFIFLSVLGIWMLWEGWNRKSHVLCGASGLILGLSCLTRAEGLIWLGAICIVPLCIVFFARGARVDKRATCVSFGIAAMVFLIVVSPYVIFLKSLTGELSVRQGGAVAIMKGTGHSAGGLSTGGAFLALLSQPWVLLKKVGWNLSRLIPLLPKTIHYPFFFFLMVGVLTRRTKTNSLGELYMAVVCIVYVLGHCFLYLKVRYLLPVVPLALSWAGVGFWKIVEWAEDFSAHRHFKLLQGRSTPFFLVALLCILAATTLPKTLQPRRVAKLDRKDVAGRIAALSEQRLVVLASDPRIAFYANAKSVGLPKVKTFDGFLEYALNNKVDIIVMNKERTIEKKRLGRIVRLFFENSTHPSLQFLFAYPAEGESKPPHFYAYRLVPSENRSSR